MTDPSFAEDVAEREARADNGPWPVDLTRAVAEGRCPYCLRLNPTVPCVCAATGNGLYEGEWE